MFGFCLEFWPILRGYGGISRMPTFITRETSCAINKNSFPSTYFDISKHSMEIAPVFYNSSIYYHSCSQFKQ